VQTVTSAEIDYIVASFKAWCTAHGKATPTTEDAAAYFTHVQQAEPFIAERLDDDWDDFLAFLRERRLIVD